MIRTAVSIALAVGLVAAPSAMASDRSQSTQPPARQMGWLAQSVRTVVVFHGCTERLKEKFKIGPLNGI
jgi:nucleoside-specific outer membrane channel protein Tsx